MTATESAAAGWPCSTHGDRAHAGCAECGKPICGECSPGGLCPDCARIRALRRRISGLRRAAVLSLGIAVLLYAMPPLLADALMVRRGYHSNPQTYGFLAAYAGPPLLALILVWLTKRFWVALVAALPLYFAVPLLVRLGLKEMLARSYLLATAFVVFACACSIKGWWANRRVPCSRPGGGLPAATVTESAAASWPCSIHGDPARAACGRCGKFICGECNAGGFCPDCAGIRALRRRISRLRRAAVLSLGIAALSYTPEVLHDVLRIRRRSDPSYLLVEYGFLAVWVGPVLLAPILVWLTKRFSVVLVTLPSLILTLAFLALSHVRLTVLSYLLAASFLLFAWGCCIQGWRVHRRARRSGPAVIDSPP